MLPQERRKMAERVYARAVDRLRASMTPANGPLLAGVPFAVIGGREDRQYVLAGRLLYRAGGR